MACSRKLLSTGQMGVASSLVASFASTLEMAAVSSVPPVASEGLIKFTMLAEHHQRIRLGKKSPLLDG